MLLVLVLYSGGGPIVQSWTPKTDLLGNFYGNFNYSPEEG